MGVGYLGALVALLALGRYVPDGENQHALPPDGGAVRAVRGAVPAVGARAPPGSPLGRPEVFRAPLGDLARSVRRARGPHGRFLVARFLYYDALATVIGFMTVYARRTGDFSSAQLDALLGLSTLFAVAGAILAGVLAERLGPKPVLLGTVTGVAGVLVVTGVTGAGELLWVAGPVVGAALRSATAADRVLMLRLLPPERRGEEFGLYALVGRVSSGFGPLVLWSGTIWLLAEAWASPAWRRRAGWRSACSPLPRSLGCSCCGPCPRAARSPDEPARAGRRAPRRLGPRPSAGRPTPPARGCHPRACARASQPSSSRARAVEATQWRMSPCGTRP